MTRILVVEDSPTQAQQLQIILEAERYAVDLAANAEIALQIFADQSFDMIISDIMMPGGMNGAELARIVRGEFPSIFILLATGYAEAAANAATQEFPLIRKPYGREMLLDKLDEILGEVC